MSISNSEELSSAPKKPKIMKRRCTISAGPVTVHHEKVDEILPPTFKCNTCDSDYKSKSSLARHMKTIKHAVKVKSLKGMALKLTKKNLLERTGIIWGSIFWNSYFLKIQEIYYSTGTNEE